MLFVSCGDDNYLSNDNVSLGDNMSNVKNPDSDPKEEMQLAIKTLVSETCQYKNFCFYITIITI